MFVRNFMVIKFEIKLMNFKVSIVSIMLNNYNKIIRKFDIINKQV